MTFSFRIDTYEVENSESISPLFAPVMKGQRPDAQNSLTVLYNILLTQKNPPRYGDPMLEPPNRGRKIFFAILPSDEGGLYVGVMSLARKSVNGVHHGLIRDVAISFSISTEDRLIVGAKLLSELIEFAKQENGQSPELLKLKFLQTARRPRDPINAIFVDHGFSPNATKRWNLYQLDLLR